jgi:hypothetical protein
MLTVHSAGQPGLFSPRFRLELPSIGLMGPPLPAVARPTFSDEPPHDDHHLRERYPEVDHLSHRLCAPHKLLVGVVLRARPLYNPPLRGPKRCRLTLPRDLPLKPQFHQTLASQKRVVAAVSRWTLAPSGSPPSASEAAFKVGTKSGESWRFAGHSQRQAGCPLRPPPSSALGPVCPCLRGFYRPSHPRKEPWLRSSPRPPPRVLGR